MNDCILQGTTPFLVIRIKPSDALIGDIKSLELTISSRTEAPLVKHLSDCEINQEENSISYHFTESETLSFPDEGAISWQLRLKTNDGEIFGTKENMIKMTKLKSGRSMNESIPINNRRC